MCTVLGDPVSRCLLSCIALIWSLSKTSTHTCAVHQNAFHGLVTPPTYSTASSSSWGGISNSKYLYGLVTPPTYTYVHMYIHLYITSIAVSTLKAFLHPFCTCYVPLTSLVRIWSEPEHYLWVHYACDYVCEGFIYVRM